MIKFVLENTTNPRPVTPNEWVGTDMADIVLYMTNPGNNSFAVLRRIQDADGTCRYGFVNCTKLFFPHIFEPISSNINTHFTAQNAAECITKAVKGHREVVGFSTVREALAYIVANLA